ncbi:MAG: NAD(P)-dependent oxidoreductase [Planctomycetaceae bacterium]|nr:NAD(P)-dependent oxidoreductase [Planctomycetaceae bacterium]
MHVLITGAAGYIGRQLSAGLEGEHQLRLADLRPSDDPRAVTLDVTDLAQAERAMQGIDAVVHLAIASGHEGDFENDAFNRQRYDVNVRGTFNLLEAARRVGVKRFVQTSSLTVVWGYPPPHWVAGDAPARPVGTYALTKQLAEVQCEYFARTHGLSVVCLRIAKPIDLADPTWRQRMLRPQWIAMPELIEAYRLALIAPQIGFEIVTLVGESSRRRWDLSRAQAVLGYQPRVRLDELGYTIGDETAPLT